MNKEQIYDEQISPLMVQIIEICKESKIAMVFSFYLPDGEQNTLHCSSALVSDEYEPSESLLEAWAVICPESRPMTQIITRNSNGETTAISVCV